MSAPAHLTLLIVALFLAGNMIGDGRARSRIDRLELLAAQRYQACNPEWPASAREGRLGSPFPPPAGRRQAPIRPRLVADAGPHPVARSTRLPAALAKGSLHD